MLRLHNHRYYLVACCIIFFLSCKHDPIVVVNNINEIKNPYNIPLLYEYNHESNNFKSSLVISLWMFKNNHIANWLGEDDNGTEIYEPVNVLWIDYVSKNTDEAKNRVAGFLSENSFKTRGGSSTGYFVFMGDEENTKKIIQNPADKTWSDGSALVNNNHGRIFTQIDNTGNAFYTLAAFSREKGISHNFISFNDARNALHQKGDWIVDNTVEFLPNIYLPGVNHNFSTKDHDGVSLFVLYP